MRQDIWPISIRSEAAEALRGLIPEADGIVTVLPLIMFQVGRRAQRIVRVFAVPVELVEPGFGVNEAITPSVVEITEDVAKVIGAKLGKDGIGVQIGKLTDDELRAALLCHLDDVAAPTLTVAALDGPPVVAGIPLSAIVQLKGQPSHTGLVTAVDAVRETAQVLWGNDATTDVAISLLEVVTASGGGLLTEPPPATDAPDSDGGTAPEVAPPDSAT